MFHWTKRAYSGTVNPNLAQQELETKSKIQDEVKRSLTASEEVYRAELKKFSDGCQAKIESAKAELDNAKAKLSDVYNQYNKLLDVVDYSKASEILSEGVLDATSSSMFWQFASWIATLPIPAMAMALIFSFFPTDFSATSYVVGKDKYAELVDINDSVAYKSKAAELAEQFTTARAANAELLGENVSILNSSIQPRSIFAGCFIVLLAVWTFYFQYKQLMKKNVVGQLFGSRIYESASKENLESKVPVISSSFLAKVSVLLGAVFGLLGYFFSLGTMLLGATSLHPIAAGMINLVVPSLLGLIGAISFLNLVDSMLSLNLYKYKSSEKMQNALQKTKNMMGTDGSDLKPFLEKLNELDVQLSM